MDEIQGTMTRFVSRSYKREGAADHVVVTDVGQTPVAREGSYPLNAVWIRLSKQDGMKSTFANLYLDPENAIWLGAELTRIGHDARMRTTDARAEARRAREA